MSDYNVIVDRRKVDPIGLTYSKVDPGGLDTCSFNLPEGSAPLPGTKVSVYKGATCVWMGDVEEPGQRHAAGRSSVDVSCVGPGKAGLSRTPYSMVYIDRDLSRWRGISRSRQVTLLAGLFMVASHEALRDAATGSPALRLMVAGDWGQKPICEAWYDAGPSNYISSLRATWNNGSTVSPADPKWVWAALLEANDSQAAGTNGTGSLLAAGPGTVSLSANTSTQRCALLQLYYDLAPSTGHVNTQYPVDWTNLRVIGSHGLSVRGASADEEGVYAGDVIRDAIRRSGFVCDVSQIEDASHYIIRHLVEYAPVMPEKWITDVAALVAWHWGVWESGPLGDMPEAIFTQRPSNATCTVAYSDVENLSLTERLSAMHDSALVHYTDAAGSLGRVTVSKTHPRLPDDVNQAIPIDVGLADSNSAQALGLAYLSIDQSASRVAGECDLPPIVRLVSGGEIASDLLRPGLDRIQIRGIPTTGSVLLDSGAEQIDHFRISRLTVTVDQNGYPKTRISFDSGHDLADTLNARLRIASVLAGAGG